MDKHGNGLDDAHVPQKIDPPTSLKPVLIGFSGNRPIYRIDGKIVIQ